MKKFLRGTYLAVCYVIGLPILFAMLLVMILVTIIKDFIDYHKLDLHYAKELMLGALSGIIDGHKRNMEFVKHGNDYTKYFSEEQES